MTGSRSSGSIRLTFTVYPENVRRRLLWRTSPYASVEHANLSTQGQSHLVAHATPQHTAGVKEGIAVLRPADLARVLLWLTIDTNTLSSTASHRALCTQHCIGDRGDLVGRACKHHCHPRAHRNPKGLHTSKEVVSSQACFQAGLFPHALSTLGMSWVIKEVVCRRYIGPLRKGVALYWVSCVTGPTC